MKNFDIVILGSGASGCMCALSCENKNLNIAILDKNKLPAKKLMATGNGRCNLTNLQTTPSINFYNQNIDKYLKVFSSSSALTFFEKLGLVWHADDEGRVYPLSNTAKSVIDVINNNLNKKHNISIFNEQNIEKIEKIGEKFEIFTQNDVFSCNKLVFALGGGTTSLLEKFNLKFKNLTPSLCALKTKENTRLLNNLRLSDVNVKAITQSGKQCSEIGEVLFKENGLSGIVIFNLSSLFAREGLFKGKINIDLLPNLKEKELFSFLSSRKTLDVQVSNFFDGLFAKELSYYILNLCKIKEDRSCAQLNNEEISLLCKCIKNLEFNVISNYENNQVYSGGVLLNELNDTLESKSCKNLYVIGEACDVDGVCGGFNLQWAWTSGYIAGKSL